MQPIYLYRDGKTSEQRVDRFPEPPRAVATVNMHTMGWSGTIKIEATLALEPEEGDWFVVHSETIAGCEHKRKNVMTNLVGCFIWMRAVVTPATERGRVDRVLVI